MKEHTLRVLLVDDDEIDRLLVQRSLEQAQSPVSVTEAENAKISVELLKDRRFDCVLLDFSLGDAWGLEVLKEYKKHDLNDTPVVMLTGLEDENLAMECLKQGAQDYLIKSEVNAHTLLRSIRYAMERKKSAKLAEATAVDLAAEKEKNLILTRLNREMRKPLNPIAGFADLMQIVMKKDSLEKQELFTDKITSTG